MILSVVAHPYGCSTPYGIRGLALNLSGRSHRTLSKCSTPYGIRGLAPRLKSGGRSPLRCAQRLTASEVWHTGVGNLGGVTVVCSTPYGIRGLAPLDLSKASHNRAMCSTPYGIRGLARISQFYAGKYLWMCSTPYGIRGLALGLTGTLYPLGLVLNALRHQRFGTSYSPNNHP